MKKIIFTIYVSQINDRINAAIAELKSFLEDNHSGEYILNVVNVLDMPEKAVENGIYVTPTLVRDLPEPVVKVLGDLSNMHKALTKISILDDDSDEKVIIL